MSTLPGGAALHGRADMIVRRRLALYRPFHTGSRFSVKARKPSMLSSES